MRKGLTFDVKMIVTTHVLEADVWVGDVLRFAHCARQVTQPREPFYKLSVVMGFIGAVKAVAQKGCCDFCLAVDQPGHLLTGEGFELAPGPRRQRITESFHAKMAKHLR